MGHPPQNILVFCLGCIGALAPEIVRLYELRFAPPKEGFSSKYFIFSIMFSLLGGVVAVTLPSVTYHAALYAGVTTPTLLSTVNRRIKTSKVTLMSNQAEPDPQSGKAARRLSELLRTHANGLFGQSPEDK
jgi:hypothetical protein